MRILIIDDDAPVRYMLRETCLFAGWEPVTCSNGKEGLETFKQMGADVVLVDYHMPEMDGMMTVRELRTFDDAVPILVLTVDERQEIADRFLNEGATDFALKPVKAPDLISRIQLHKRLFEVTRKNNEEVFVTKGINQTTLSYVTQFLRTSNEPCTIDEIAQEVGLAYPTVYRYVVYLLHKGKIKTIVHYQNIGRPKNRYQWMSAASYPKG